MNDAKEEIRTRLAIEDVIGEYVQLKRAGRLWKGLSPFTTEKTPSFMVTPERNIWHDFSSNRGGDIFSFIMEMEGVDFRGAMEILARKAGVDLSQYDTKKSREIAGKKNRILEMNALAAKYFQQHLVKTPEALEYVKKRNLKKETLVEWQIGYAPDNSGLKGLLEKRGFTAEEIRGAGLIGPRGGEMFRGRLQIPLCDGQGQIVGFTGRIIGEGEPKYLNTPQTLLYDKGRQVFGLHLAKKAIREADEVVLVEGNLDVISSHQAGIKNVVATAGTALTADHLKSLSRLSENIVLCFDADKAGVAATERSIPIAQTLGLKLKVMTIIDAKDPDELIQKDPAQWQAAIANQKPAPQWLIDVYTEKLDVKSADGRTKLTDIAMRIIRKLSDPVEREHYLRYLSEITEISMTALNAKLENVDDITTPFMKKNKVEKQAIKRTNQENYLNYIFASALKQGAFQAKTLLKNIPDRYLDKTLYQIRMFVEDEIMEVLGDDEVATKLAELELIADEKFKEPTNDEILEYYRQLELANYREDLDSFKQQFATAEDMERMKILNETIQSYNKIVNELNQTGVADGFEKLFNLWKNR